MIREPSIEVGPALNWTKSSYSTPDGPDCVEMAVARDQILVRDSKAPRGPRLALTPTTWAAFLPYAARS